MPSFRRIFLHGFGSSALEARAHCAGHLKFEDAAFFDGLEADPFSGRRRWFPFSTNERNLAQGVHEATAILEDRLRHWLETEGGSKDDAIAIAGHSQGGMIALHLFQRQRLNVISADIFAAFLPAPLHGQCAMHRGLTSLGPRIVTLYASTRDRYIRSDDFKATYEHFAVKDRAFRAIQFWTTKLEHAFSRDWLEPKFFQQTTILDNDQVPSCGSC